MTQMKSSSKTLTCASADDRNCGVRCIHAFSDADMSMFVPDGSFGWLVSASVLSGREGALVLLLMVASTTSFSVSIAVKNKATDFTYYKKSHTAENDQELINIFQHKICTFMSNSPSSIIFHHPIYCGTF